MGVGNRAAACASCGKRLSRKQWYYRNGKYFCKKRCWVTEKAKAQQDAGKDQAVKEAPKKEAPKENAAPAAS
ncbi:MAG: hypothetical protein HYY58_03845 [Candidatus Omnitrophica bacterium]|nr:hypothetical protein [Candidatus Omnitrophota bacterium]